MRDLVERARQAAAEIVAHQPAARTGAHRRAHQARQPAQAGRRPRRAARRRRRRASRCVLILFDLDGFKNYNDTFGHLAGDALLARLGGKLAAAVADHGTAYRLGGDEFCVLLTRAPSELDAVVAAAAGALEERGENFADRRVLRRGADPARGDNARLRAAARRRAHVRAQEGPPVAGGRPGARRADAHHAGQAALARGPLERRRRALPPRRPPPRDERARSSTSSRAPPSFTTSARSGIPDAILDKPGAADRGRVGVHAPAHAARRAHPERRPGAAARSP